MQKYNLYKKILKNRPQNNVLNHKAYFFKLCKTVFKHLRNNFIKKKLFTYGVCLSLELSYSLKLLKSVHHL